MSGLIRALHVVGSRIATPDPAVLQAIGLNHSLESAVADLIDNSIDASASRVLVRFVTKNHRVVQVMVVEEDVII